MTKASCWTRMILRTLIRFFQALVPVCAAHDDYGIGYRFGYAQGYNRNRHAHVQWLEGFSCGLKAISRQAGQTAKNLRWLAGYGDGYEAAYRVGERRRRRGRPRKRPVPGWLTS